MSGDFDPDKQVKNSRELDESFGVIKNKITNNFVKYKAFANLDNCEDLPHEMEKYEGKDKTIIPVGSNIDKKNVPIEHRFKKQIKKKDEKNKIKKWIAKGKTVRYKSLLKNSGFEWDKQQKVWYTFDEPNLELDGVDIYQINLPTKIRELSKPKTEKQESESSPKTRWVAKGNTYAMKEELKAIGMKWDTFKKEWYTNEKPGYIIRGIVFTEKKNTK